MKIFRINTYELLAKNQKTCFLAAFITGFFVFGIFSVAAQNSVSSENKSIEVRQAQNALTGEWTAQTLRNKSGEIQITFLRNAGTSTYGDSFALGELQNLTEGAITSAKTNVNFSLVREAGNFNLEGYFSEGKGVGFWTFAPNKNFVSALRSRGYDNLTDENILRAAMHKLTIKNVDDLKSAGYEQLEFNQLLRASSRGINIQYVKEVQAMGFDKQPIETLVRMRNHKITPEFTNQMRSAGFENLSIEQLIRLKKYEITTEYINGLKAEGYSDVTAETAVRLKSRGVDRDFIQRVKAKGFTDLTLEQLVKLRSQNVIR